MRWISATIGVVLCIAASDIVRAQEAPAASAVSAPSTPAEADINATTQSAPDFLNKFSLSAGASAWTGDYGAKSNSDIQAALFGARYSLGDLRLTASIPYMRIDSAGALFTGLEGAPLIVAPGALPHKTIRKGFGDLTLGASYFLPSEKFLGVDVELISRVKLPTASTSSGLSTGKTDYSFGTEISKTFDKFSPFASVSYRRFGDTNQWRLKDGFATSIGSSYKITNTFIVLASYDYAQRTSAFIRDDHEIVTSASYRFPRSPIRLSGYTSYGLSTGAAAFSGGLSLSVSL